MKAFKDTPRPTAPLSVSTTTKPSPRSSDRKKVVRLLALNLNPRDLSIGLIMLKEYALKDPVIADNYEIHIHQWTKRYEAMETEDTLDGLNLDELVEQLSPLDTDVFGFSMYIWNQTFMTELARRLKAVNPNVITLFGGSQAGGYGPRMLEEHAYADYSIKGEAEYAFREFLLAHLGGDYSSVPNLFYRKGGQVHTNIPSDPRATKKMSYLPTIEDLPLPYQSQEYRDYLDNLEAPVTAQFETERGCPLSCAFCSWGTRLPIRRRRQEDVEAGLTFLLHHPKVRAVYIVDANPFISNEKGLWLTEYLLHKNDSGKPVFFELNPEYVRDPRVIDNLGKLQGDELAFGVQSTADSTLKRIKRRFNREIYERNVHSLRAANPDANIKFSLILGLPGDTLTTFRASLDFVIGMVPSDVYVHDLLILPGSEMYDDPASFGIEIDRNPPHQLIRNETFPPEDYRKAKHLGFHVKLITRFRWLRDQMLELKQELGFSHVDLYRAFVTHLVSKGVDALEGHNVDSVSSETFDARTQAYLSHPAHKDLLRDHFETFRAVQAKTSPMAWLPPTQFVSSGASPHLGRM